MEALAGGRSGIDRLLGGPERCEPQMEKCVVPKQELKFVVSRNLLHDNAKGSAREHWCVVTHFDQLHDDRYPQIMLIDRRQIQPIAFDIPYN